MTNDYYVVGSRQDILGGAKFTCGSTDNGFCYKSEQAIKERKGICYIAECDFDDTNELVITDENIYDLISMGGVETWESAIQQVKDCLSRLDEFKNYLDSIETWDLFNNFADYITECGLDQCDWQCFGTWLVEIDLQECLEDFKAEKVKVS